MTVSGRLGQVTTGNGNDDGVSQARAQTVFRSEGARFSHACTRTLRAVWGGPRAPANIFAFYDVGDRFFHDV